MAVTISIVDKGRMIFGGANAVLADITGDSSYDAGGEAFSATELAALAGLPDEIKSAANVMACFSERNATGHSVGLDRSGSKIRFFTTSAEVSGGTNLSAVTVRALFIYGKTV